MNDNNVVSLADARKGRGNGSGNGGSTTPPTRISAPLFHTEEHEMLDIFNNVAESHVNADGTKSYFAACDIADPTLAGVISETVLSGIALSFKLENAMRDKGKKWQIPRRLPPWLIAEALIRSGDFVHMVTAEGSEVLMRQRSGRN